MSSKVSRQTQPSRLSSSHICALRQKKNKNTTQPTQKTLMERFSPNLSLVSWSEMLQREPLMWQVYKPFLSICLFMSTQMAPACRCPAPAPPLIPRVALVLVLFLFSVKQLWNPAGAALLWRVLVGVSRALQKLSAAQWHLSWKNMVAADAWTPVGTEPVLASSSVFPSCIRQGGIVVLTNSPLRLSLLPSTPPHFFSIRIYHQGILSGSSEPLGFTRITSSGKDVKLMHAIRSSLGPTNSDSLYPCNVCRVLKLCGVG